MPRPCQDLNFGERFLGGIFGGHFLGSFFGAFLGRFFFDFCAFIDFVNEFEKTT